MDGILPFAFLHMRYYIYNMKPYFTFFVFKDPTDPGEEVFIHELTLSFFF